MERPYSRTVEVMEVMPPPPPPLDDEETAFDFDFDQVPPPPKLPPPPAPARERKQAGNVAGKNTLKSKLENIYRDKAEAGAPDPRDIPDGFVEPRRLGQPESQGADHEAASESVKLMASVIGQLRIQLSEPGGGKNRRSRHSSKRSSARRSIEQKAGAKPLGSGTCTACSREIGPDDSFFSDGNGEDYHRECVRCSHCGTAEGDSFLSVDGRVLCQSSFTKLYSGRACGTCNELADPQDILVQTRGRVFHVDCFKCADCGEELARVGADHKTLETSPFKAAPDGSLKCALHASSRRCFGCGDPVKLGEASIGAALKAGAAPEVFHSRCFSCSVCERSISESGGGYVVSDHGVIYCKEHFAEALDLNCSACQSPIPAASKYVQAFGEEKFHTECFKCVQCGSTARDELNLSRRGELECLSCRR